MDDFDQAAKLELAHRNRLIKQAGKTPDRAGTADCRDCGEPIPYARRQSVPHATRCIDCQTSLEARNGL